MLVRNHHSFGSFTLLVGEFSFVFLEENGQCFSYLAIHKLWKCRLLSRIFSVKLAEKRTY